MLKIEKQDSVFVKNRIQRQLENRVWWQVKDQVDIGLWILVHRELDNQIITQIGIQLTEQILYVKNRRQF